MARELEFKLYFPYINRRWPCLPLSGQQTAVTVLRPAAPRAADGVSPSDGVSKYRGSRRWSTQVSRAACCSESRRWSIQVSRAACCSESDSEQTAGTDRLVESVGARCSESGESVGDDRQRGRPRPMTSVTGSFISRLSKGAV